MLTAGVDQGALFTGGAGNDTFNATGATLTALDSIDGGTGTNTLSILDAAGVLNTTLPAGVVLKNIQTATINTAGGLGSVVSAGSAAVAAVKEVDTITIASVANSVDTYTVTYGGVSLTTAATDASATLAESATLIAGAINGIAGSTVATVVGDQVVVTAAVAGTALPTYTIVSKTSGTADVVNRVTKADTIANGAGSTAVAATVDAVYDVSGITGLTTLTAQAIGTSNLKAAATTNITLTETAQAAYGVTVNGGKDVSIVSGGVTTGAITVGAATAAAGAVTIASTTTANAAGAIAVTGGKTVTITQTAGNAVNTASTMGTVAVTGDANTTTVSATASKVAAADATTVGVTANTVTVTDVNNGHATKAGTITTVTASGYTTLTVNDNALTTLNATNGSGNITIANSGLTTATNKTLALNVNGLTGGTFDDADIYTTLNVTTSGAASLLAGITDTALKTLTVAGDQVLTVTSLGGATALETITVSGAAGLTSNTSTGLGALKSFVSTSTGNNSITVDATAVTVTGGAGNDTITYEAAIGATAKIDLGAGDDSLKLSTAASTAGATITAGEGTDALVVMDGAFIDGVVTYTSFEKADLTGLTGSTLNMTNLASANQLVASGAFGAANVTNIAAGTAVNLTAAGTDYTTGAILTYALKTDTATDALTVTLANTDDVKKAVVGKGDDGLGGNITVTGLTVNDIETLTIDSTVANIDGGVAGTATEGKHTADEYEHVVSMITGDTDLATLTLKGNASLKITDVTTNVLTKVDASLMTGKMTINLDASANIGAVAVLGGSNVDTITMTNNSAVNNIIVGNGGADVIVLAASGTKETVRIAADTDSVLTLADTTTPVVTPVVMDTAKGYDVVTNFISGQDKIELSSVLGLATGDARTAIVGKAGIGDGTITDNAELAGILQTLIGTGTGFFNDGAANRALATVVIDDTADSMFVFIDTNADGNFTNGTDQAIQLAGVTTLLITDVVFG